MKKSSMLLSIVVIVALLLKSCSIRPAAWSPSQKPEFSGVTALNEKLSGIEKISLRGWYGPEDIVMDSAGNLYCGVHIGEEDFSDGRILKISPDGKVEEFYNAGSWVAGLHFDTQGNLIALSHKLGLISISPEKKVTVLADKDEKGNPFLIPNGLDIASDGKIYFSNTSDVSPYTIKYGRKIVLELSPIGGFYSYDPKSKKLETLIDGTYFGNGVVLSKDESFVLMTETTKYRVLRYWLKGEKAGQTEIFADNLPGFPNGISIREDGSFWLGFSTKRNDDLDKIHHSPGMKKFVYALPNFLQPKPELFGMILNLSTDGQIINALFDTTGTFTPETGAVKEYNGYLFIGGDVVPYIAKYKIENTTTEQANVPVNSTKRPKTLYDEFGKNKKLPQGYEKQILQALSHFPELSDTKIEWRINEAYTPVSVRPALMSMFRSKSQREYIITISNQTIDTLKQLLFENLSFEKQVGIMGHELSHIVDFKNKSVLQSLLMAIGHLSPRYLDRMEYSTDLICIEHGLGKELEAYSQHVRTVMNVENWRGVDYVTKDDQNIERYMNPGTIEKFMNGYALNTKNRKL